MKGKPIHQRSILYIALQRYVNTCIRLFCRRINIIGKENLPKDGAIIFAPNHQNALLDALLFLVLMRREVVFVARADMFKNKTAAFFLRFLKIAPAYRIRDGYSNLGKNDETMQQAVDTLVANVPFAIMPEGNHGDKRRLRPLMKGIFRIAFAAQEKLREKNQKVYIVPVGIDYNNYEKFGQGVILNICQPIDISQHIKSFQADPAHAVNTLREELQSKLSSVMIDIPSEEYYESIYTLARMNNHEPFHTTESFIKRKKLTVLLNEEAQNDPNTFAWLHKAVIERNKKLNENKIDTATSCSIPDSKWFLRHTFALIFLSPIFLYGFINHIFILLVTKKIGKLFKDRQFISSGKVGAGMLAAPLFYLIQSLLFGLICGNFMIALIYFLTLLPTGWIAAEWYLRWSEMSLQLSRLDLFKREPAVLKLEQEIISFTRFLLSKKEGNKL
jgi:1-acyl-sn-glycerol-3-phosphate acyltransferase